MSGALATVARVLDQAGVVRSALFGDSGAVVLGEFFFDGLEVPATIRWGGQHQMTVHRLPGGRRVVDRMGPDDAPIRWSGIFLGEDGARRAEELDRMRREGRVHTLAWGEHSLDVVISSFAADSKALHVPYEITCEVVRDNAADRPEEPGLLATVKSGISIAANIGSRIQRIGAVL